MIRETYKLLEYLFLSADQGVTCMNCQIANRQTRHSSSVNTDECACFSILSCVFDVLNLIIPT